MKKILVLAAILFSINGFAQKTTNTANNASLPAQLSSGNDSMQYVLGAYLGLYMNNSGFAVSNPALFKRGLEDVLNGKTLLVYTDSIPRLMNKYEKLTAKERYSQQEKGLFEKVKGQAGIGVLPSGVCYTIVKAGTGNRPQLEDSIQIHLKGFFADGRQFEDTYPKNTPYKSTPANVIPGMREVLQIMPVGSLWRIYIPSTLGFGEKGLTGVIPPYSALIYEVELLKLTVNPQKTGGN